ncbi:hypothetical protein [Vibrio sp. A1-1]|uniref:hypothetical protein n=1 Tax=Vibrio sp. A1-1 TaxID=2912250 RepID=UPI001F412C94|nr:hypothetical protein [Vibrio sp. A1-1]MCF7456232.1 hypothetical protein [Vibrio sp. A1-1]
MKVALNFADENFSRIRRLNSKTAKWFGNFDKVFEFTPKDIDDEFFEANKSILCQKRGGGYWLWKPYFINETLKRQSYGDYIFYCDSGAFYINSIDHLIERLESSKQDIMLFEAPLIEGQWTNEYLLNSLGFDNDAVKFSNQIIGGYILIKKTESSVSFIRDYLELCTNENYLTDIKTKKNEMAFSHRHDQSILSVLAKSKNIKPFKDPSDYGKFPFRYFSKDRLFRINTNTDEYPVIVLSNRKANPYIYALKYYLRSLLKMIVVNK